MTGPRGETVSGRRETIRRRDASFVHFCKESLDSLHNSIDLPSGLRDSIFELDSECLNMHTGRYVAGKTKSPDAKVTRSRAHTSTFTPGCLRRDVSLWLSER